MSENVSVLNKNNYYIMRNNRDQIFVEGYGANKKNYIFTKIDSNVSLTTMNDTVFLNSIQLSINKEDVFEVTEYLKKAIMCL